MRTRRVPLRKCVACQQMMAKKDLIRIVRTPEGSVNIDLKGKMSGRGAYLCGSVACFRLAKKSRALDRALAVTVDHDIYDRLEADFIKVEDEFLAAKAADPDE